MRRDENDNPVYPEISRDPDSQKWSRNVWRETDDPHVVTNVEFRTGYATRVACRTATFDETVEEANARSEQVKQEGLRRMSEAVQSLPA